MGRPTRAAAAKTPQTKVPVKPAASKVSKKKEPVVQAIEMKQNLKKQLATPINKPSPAREAASPRVGRPRRNTEEPAAKSPKPVVKEIPASKNISTTLQNATSPRPRGPGRPKKSVPNTSPEPKLRKNAEEDKPEEVISPRPRGPGRPRKSSPPPQPTKKAVQKDVEVEEVISPRPRGRPRKSSSHTSPQPQPVIEPVEKIKEESVKETPRRGRSGAVDKSPARSEESEEQSLKKKETTKRVTRKDKKEDIKVEAEEENGEEGDEKGEEDKAMSRRREAVRSSPRAAKKATKSQAEAAEEDATVGEEKEEDLQMEVEECEGPEEDVQDGEEDGDQAKGKMEIKQACTPTGQEKSEEKGAESEAMEKGEQDKENAVEEEPKEAEPVDEAISPDTVKKKKKKKTVGSMQFKEISVRQAQNTFAKLKSSAQQSPQVSLDFSKATLKPSIVRTKKVAPKPKPKTSQSIKKLVDTLSLTPKQAQHLMKSLAETSSKVGQEVKYMVSTDASTGQAMLLQMPQQKPPSPRKASNDLSTPKAKRPVTAQKPAGSLDLTQAEESTPKRRRISAASQEMESDPNLHEFLKKRKERKGVPEESTGTPASSSNIIVRCSACKKYFEPGRDFSKHKEQCLRLHARCPNCQKYYPKGEYDEHTEFCGAVTSGAPVPSTTPGPSNIPSTVDASAIRTVKSPAAGQFNCLICRQVFGSYREMRHHEEKCALVQPGDHGGIMCSDCRQVFVNRIFLSRHKTQYPGCPRKPINYPGSTPRRAAAMANQQVEATILPEAKLNAVGQPPINLMVSFDNGVPKVDLKTGDHAEGPTAVDDLGDDGLTEAERNMVLVQGVTMADGTPVSKCPLCEKLFKHIQYLKKHFQAFHHLDFSSYVRVKDTRRNARSETLRHNAQEKSCMCLDCGQNIPSRVELSAHKKVCTKKPVVSGSTVVAFPCTLCNEITFSSRLALYEHIRQAHNEDAVLAQPAGSGVDFGYKVIEQVSNGEEEMQAQMVKEEKPQLAMQEYVTQEVIEQQQAVPEEAAVEQEEENVIRVQGDTNFITVKMVTDTDKEGKEMVLDLNRLRSLMKPDEKGMLTVPLSALQGAAVEAMEETQEVVYETQEGQMELPEGHQVVTEYVPEEHTEVIKMEDEELTGQQQVSTQNVVQQQVPGQVIMQQQQIPNSTVVSTIIQQGLIQQQQSVLQSQEVADQTLIEHAVIQPQVSQDQVHEGQQQYFVQTADGTVLEAVTIGSTGQEMVVDQGVHVATTAEMQIAQGQVMVEGNAADPVETLTQVVDATQLQTAEADNAQPLAEGGSTDAVESLTEVADPTQMETAEADNPQTLIETSEANAVETLTQVVDATQMETADADNPQPLVETSEANAVETLTQVVDATQMETSEAVNAQPMEETSAAEAVQALAQVVDAAQMENAEAVDAQPIVEAPADDKSLPETQTNQGEEITADSQLTTEQDATELMDAVYQ